MIQRCLTIVLAAAANLVIATLWYSPLLFGGVVAQEGPVGTPAPFPVAMGGAFLVTVLVAVLLDRLLQGAGVETVSGAARFVGLAWLAFVVPIYAYSVLFFGRPIVGILIDLGYNLVAVTVAAAILILRRRAESREVAPALRDRAAH